MTKGMTLGAILAATLAATPAYAGEITGNGKDITLHAKSACAFSGYNDTPNGLWLPIGPNGTLVQVDPREHRHGHRPGKLKLTVSDLRRNAIPLAVLIFEKEIDLSVTIPTDGAVNNIGLRLTKKKRRK